MSENKSRDIILILVVVGLAVLILLPDRKGSDGESGDKAQSETGSALNSALLTDESESEKTILGVEPGASAPLKDIPHEYMPLVPGSSWVYRVEAADKFALGETWTMRVISKPTEEEPGVVEVGFDDKIETARVWLDGLSLRFDGLPFVEPAEFLGNRPTETAGELLPAGERLGEGAVWVHETTRNVIYQYRDEKRRPAELKARAEQKDRALVQESETVTVPAGQFKGWRVSWISRIEMSAKGRQVLKDLTSEPFRKEIMWLVPGVGIVKRKIDYTAYRGAQITMDLIRYFRPEIEPKPQQTDSQQTE